MKSMHRTRRAAVLAIILAIVAISGCGGSDKGTNPPAGGGLEMNSGDIAASATYAHTFASAGAFGYHCTRHSGMNGSVVVQAGAPTLASVSIVSNAFNPTTATVGVGGTVTWTNNSGALHTVTSH